VLPRHARGTELIDPESLRVEIADDDANVITLFCFAAFIGKAIKETLPVSGVSLCRNGLTFLRAANTSFTPACRSIQFGSNLKSGSSFAAI